MLRRLVTAAALLSAASIPARAAVIRGKVTSALGVPAAGARVQLIRLNGGARSVAESIAGPDGSYEIRTAFGGRFLLLTSPPILSRALAPQIGAPFYAGRNDLLTVAIALNPAVITAQVSAGVTGRETPLPQLATSIVQLPPPEIASAAALLPDLRDQPGVFAVERGPTGSPGTLYVRGASPDATPVQLDGISAEDLGGSFNFATLSATGLAGPNAAPAALELVPSALPLHGVDAEAATVALRSVRASTVRPSLTYAGDAGPLDTLRNEATVTASPGRADLLAAFSRFDTANEGPAAPFHLASAATNLGYGISAGTSLRATARRDVLSGPLAAPYRLFGMEPSGKEASQNLYASLNFQTCTAGAWCNELEYGLVRKRSQAFDFTGLTAGLPVVVTGANGYTARGIATFPLTYAREDLVTDRDQFKYNTRYAFNPYVAIDLSEEFDIERGADLQPAVRQTVERRHLRETVGLQGQFLHQRFFYEASGFLDHSNFLGFTGAPRAGLTYAPVRPGVRRFRGTVLHLALAEGVREPSLQEQINTSRAASPDSRSLDATVDQTVLPRKLVFRATYFHSQFSHQFELLAPRMPSQTLGYRAQGLESELRFQLSRRLLLRGGYSYLAALVEQSAASPVVNPVFPAIPIGALTALPGARPFHRPPNSGFASVAYAGRLLTASLRAASAGRSDDSTNLPQTPALLLPNRNLSPGYTALDATVAFAVTHRITLYSEMTNLLGDRHMAPIGYTSTPFVARTGLRVRLGGE